MILRREITGRWGFTAALSRRAPLAVVVAQPEQVLENDVERYGDGSLDSHACDCNIAKRTALEDKAVVTTEQIVDARRNLDGDRKEEPCISRESTDPLYRNVKTLVDAQIPKYRGNPDAPWLQSLRY